MRPLVCVCVLAVVTSPVHAAKGAADTAAPTITHEPPGTCPTAPTDPTTTATTAPAPCRIEAGIVDDTGVFDPTLLFRLKGTAAFDRVAMKPVADTAGRYEAVVPSSVAAAGDVEYLIEAFDVEGNGPARAGTEAGPLLLVRAVAPLVVVPPPVAPPPDDSTGLVIGVVAGVAAAVVIGLGVGVAVYALRPPAVDVIAVNVEGPAPFVTAVP